MLTSGVFACVTYDKNEDYLITMARAVIENDTQGLIKAVTLRNAKIRNENLGYEELTPKEFIENFELYTGFSITEDYSDLMLQACINGDHENGKLYEEKRNIKINIMGMDYIHVSYDDLVLLSKIIYAEAGSDWLSLDWKMAVGEVVINRVLSPEFPDTLHDVIYQRGQYSSANTIRFKNILPNYESALAALKLLSGEKIINDVSVVFQANFKQGSGVAMDLYDSYLGHTYLCYSNKPNLYI